MAKGSSGRIVLEIDPDLKKQLYSILALENLTLKEWFLLQANQMVDEKKATLFDFINNKKQDEI